MNSLKKQIQALTESKDEKVKKVAGELMLAFKVYEDKNKDISSYVKQQLSGIDSEETKEVINFVEHKYAVDNMGMRKALKILEKSKAHKLDSNLQHLVNVYQLELMDGVPEHMLAKSFIKNFKKYENVNEAAYDAYHTISQNYDKNRAHQLVANAIYILENDQNVEFLQDVIKSLNMAFNLPGSHVKAFVYQSLRDRADMHPALEALLEELRYVDAKTQEKINYYTDRFGRVAISKRLSPVLEHKDEKVFLIKNNLFVVGEKTMRKVNHDDMKKIMEHKDGERFLELCKIITNFNIVENKMIATDGINTYTIETIKEEKVYEVLKDDIIAKMDNYLEGLTYSGDFDAGEIADSKKEHDDIKKKLEKLDDPTDEEIAKIFSEVLGDDEIYDEVKAYESKQSKYKFYVNNELKGETIQKISESFDDDGANDQIGELINMILSNFDLVNFLDGITTFNPEYNDDTVDMMQDGNVIYVVITDDEGLMGGDVISGEPEEIATEVKKDMGIDITPEIDKEVNEDDESNTEKEGELMDLEGELEIIEANLKKIDDLDEELKGDEEIMELEKELLLEKETLIKRIAELNGEVDQNDNKDEIIKQIIDQLSKLIQPETALAQTEEEPEATQEGTTIESGNIKITPFVRYSRNEKEITFESLIGIEGLNDKAKAKILENKDIDTIAESNLVIKLRGDTEMNEEVSGILQVVDLKESDDEEDEEKPSKKDDEPELDDDGNPIIKKDDEPELDDDGNPIIKKDDEEGVNEEDEFPFKNGDRVHVAGESNKDGTVQSSNDQYAVVIFDDGDELGVPHRLITKLDESDDEPELDDDGNPIIKKDDEEETIEEQMGLYRSMVSQDLDISVVGNKMIVGNANDIETITEALDNAEVTYEISGNEIIMSDLNENAPGEWPADKKAIEAGFDKDKIVKLSKWAADNGGDEVDSQKWVEKATELFGDAKAAELIDIYGI